MIDPIQLKLMADMKSRLIFSNQKKESLKFVTRLRKKTPNAVESLSICLCVEYFRSTNFLSSFVF